MAEIYRLHGDPHDEIQALLPWYVNGTLAPKDSARVEAHLSDCAECRAELASERKLAEGIATMPLDIEHGWSAMKQRMAADSAAAQAPVRQSFWRRRVTIGWAVAAPVGAAAAVALAFLAMPNQTPREQTYRALGSPAASFQGNLVVLFRPETTEQQMRLILTENGARLVDGPTSAGAYVLQVDEARRDQIVQRLRRAQLVTLAEPIAPPGGR